MIAEATINRNTKFQDLPIGSVCIAVIAGEFERVVKTEWIKNGSRALNAKKLDGRKGRTRVWNDSLVHVVSTPENAQERPFALLNHKAVQ